MFSWFWQVCWLDDVCWLASPMYVPDLMKYADLHHPCVFQILWSMMTSINHVCSISYQICWLASSMCALVLMSMMTCITYTRWHICTWNLSPELPWLMSLVFYMIEHTLVIQVSILRINSTHASQHTRMKYFNCTHGWCMSTYFLLNIQVGLCTQTRTFAHIVAT